MASGDPMDDVYAAEAMQCGQGLVPTCVNVPGSKKPSQDKRGGGAPMSGYDLW